MTPDDDAMTTQSNPPRVRAAAARAALRSYALDRRRFWQAGVGVAAVAGSGALATAAGRAHQAATPESTPVSHQAMGTHPDGHPAYMPGFAGEIDHGANGFDPTEILTDFDWGRESTLDDGTTLREYDIVALNKDIELLPGTSYPAWTYNGRVPGPTIRCREGDRLRITFTNGGDHPHSMHFHGIHPGNMDGVFDAASGLIQPGETYVYEFDAEPFGVHLYHCHAFPLADHIAKGLYGMFIVDPADPWEEVDHEFVMVMAGFDLDFDQENDIYTVNTIPFHYDLGRAPIRIRVGETVRIFLANLLEFDPVNSFHLHANFFRYYPTGTSRTPAEFTDTIAQMQGQRGILEFSYKHPGRYMFHAHKTEFAELGWTGVIVVEE
jgi:FtsP/CotA-like multicopper oxidase with cupredoxin domain